MKTTMWSQTLIPVASLLFASVSALPAELSSSAQDSSCKCMPGQSCWPTVAEFNTFNKSIDGRLIATIPDGDVCHHDGYVAYDQAKCVDLRDVWHDPETHFSTSYSPMSPLWANQSCDPFLPPTAECVIGTLVQYAVNVSTSDHVAKTIAFLKQHNIRSVIRNTGHDYLGKSSYGPGAIGIWTHNLQDMTYMPNYKSGNYTGRAVRLGAGIQAVKAYPFAQQHGSVLLGGHCPTVGLVGGWTQGAGHGPLTSSYGLGADQALEWEVVTPEGKIITATPTNNSDLYWALGGGGGGTYAVVTALTVRVYPDLTTGAANLTFSGTGPNDENFYGAVQAFFARSAEFADSGAVVSFLLYNNSFTVLESIFPNKTKSQLDALYAPTFSDLKKRGIKYNYFGQSFPTFYQAYSSVVSGVETGIGQYGGRLMPRSLILNQTKLFVDTIRNMSMTSDVSGMIMNPFKPKGTPDNAVLPQWRDTLVNVVYGLTWSDTDWAQNLRDTAAITNDLSPQLARIAPNSGIYLNEGDPFQPDWKTQFYGTNYQRLLSVKNKYDPTGFLYGRTTVGSDNWVQKDNGQLCKA